MHTIPPSDSMSVSSVEDTYSYSVSCTQSKFECLVFHYCTTRSADVIVILSQSPAALLTAQLMNCLSLCLYVCLSVCVVNGAVYVRHQRVARCGITCVNDWFMRSRDETGPGADGDVFIASLMNAVVTPAWQSVERRRRRTQLVNGSQQSKQPTNLFTCVRDFI